MLQVIVSLVPSAPRPALTEEITGAVVSAAYDAA